jgi:hypothetical protein
MKNALDSNAEIEWRVQNDMSKRLEAPPFR